MEIVTFWRKVSSACSELKMEAVCSFEMLVCTYKSTQCYNPIDLH
jgi:hypothetical protein